MEKQHELRMRLEFVHVVALYIFNSEFFITFLFLFLFLFIFVFSSAKTMNVTPSWKVPVLSFLPLRI